MPARTVSWWLAATLVLGPALPGAWAAPASPRAGDAPGPASRAAAPASGDRAEAAAPFVPASHAVQAGAATARFVGLTPQRIVDTRRADIGPFGVVAAGTPIGVPITGRPGVPAGATVVAAAVTITAVDPSGPGFVTAWPEGGQRPEVSNLNIGAAGPPVPNFAIVPVAPDGTFALEPSVGTHLLVDLAGVFVTTPGTATAGRVLAVTPTRLLDTRVGAPLARGGSTAVTVAGAAGVPAGAAAAVVTVTSVGAPEPGYVTVWPAGSPRPEVSTLNVPRPGVAVANLAVVPLGTGGRIGLYAETGGHLLVDVVAFVTGATALSSRDGLFVPAGPERQLDTRLPGSRGALLGGYRADIGLRLPAGLTAGDTAMVAANLTVTGTTAELFLTAYPARTERPETSNVNADAPDRSVAAFGLVPLGAGATISLRPSARTHALVDVAGFFLGDPAPPDPDVAPTAPDAQGSAPLPAFDQRITDFLTLYGIPGASVAVAEDGRIVHARAYGTSDVTTGEPTRIEHRYRIASISKLLTAATVQRLVTAGSLRLDQKVWPLLDTRLPLPASADPRARAITVRHLLGHTSGIGASPDPFFDDHADVLAAFGPAGPTSCDEAARWSTGRPLATDPGTRYSYANVNYCLLGLVIEAVTGRPWADMVRELVQRPRQVTAMALGATYSRGPLDVAHVTPAPDAKGGGWFMESIGAAGAWLGTPVDVVRIVDGLDADKPGADLLTETQLAQMRLRPTTDPGDDQTWYGLGLVSYRRGTAFGHTGALEGSRTMTVHEANGITWSIMINAKIVNHQDVLMAAMDHALAAVSDWPDHDLGRDLP